ncbi:MAG: hypothetical protein QUV05_04795 [Phycisphaerae bacterium]|nr:hypothetical protein [Phycisphaerae bacterium]
MPLAKPTPVQAIDTTGWCGTVTGSPVVLCEDFDDYCADPPCDDAVGDDTPNQDLFLAKWASDGCLKENQIDPSVAIVANDSRGQSPPFACKQQPGAYYPDAKLNQYIYDGSSHRFDMLPEIVALDPGKGSVNGTDDHPLIIAYILDLPGDATHRFPAAQANRYLELTDGTDRAPAQVNLVDCNGKIRPNVPVDDGFDHHAVAVGVFAAISLPAQICSDGRLITYRLALYNGDRWYELRAGIWGASGDGLKVGGGLNTITMRIKSTTIEIQIDSTIDGLPSTETATAQRVYDGGFAALHLGNGACLPEVAADMSGQWDSSDYADNIALTGGVLEPPIPTGACCLSDATCIESLTSAGCVNRYAGTYAGDNVDCATANCPAPIGACCRPNGQCVETTREDCEDNLGGVFQGDFTACTPEILCCADPFADADADGDVDQADFAVLQACFTGQAGGIATGCECFDRDNGGFGDGDIDSDDWSLFELCASGPGIPANAACD